MSQKTMPHVLVVDDEAQIRRALNTILQARAFKVSEAGSAAEALEALTDSTPDLIVLDLTLPDQDGIDLCAELRTWLDIPILVLSVRADESDKIRALETGADDYLTKPFSAGELAARVNALIRRAGTRPPSTGSGVFGDISVNFAAHSVTRAGEIVALTPIEFGILALLAHNADRIVTWEQIRAGVWGAEAIVDATTMRVHVRNLRQKIEAHPSVPRLVLTEPGVGLRLDTRTIGASTDLRT